MRIDPEISDVTSNLTLSRAKKCLYQIIIKKTKLIPTNAIDIKIENWLKNKTTSYGVYFFSLQYTCLRQNVKVELMLKIFEPIDFSRIRCKKEYKILKYLKNTLLPVPEVYVLEMDESLFGAPFIIMERIMGQSLDLYIRNRPKNEVNIIVNRFAGTLLCLHELKIDKIVSDVLPIPKDNYFFAKQCAFFKDDLTYARNWNYSWVLDWLKLNYRKIPCTQYSLLHFDIQPKHFLVTKEGKIFFIDWELAQLGDALRDVSVVYHDLRNLVGNYTALSFLEHYLNNSKRKIDSPKFLFYLIYAALRQTLYFRYLTTKSGLFSLVELLGFKHIVVLPLTYLRSMIRRKQSEKFLKYKLCVLLTLTNTRKKIDSIEILRRLRD